MAITISGTTVTYNDASTTTTNTPNATAALGSGALGSYAMLTYPGNTAARADGFTLAGSSLRFSSTNGSVGATPAGSWRLMGSLQAAGKAWALTSVWLRYA